MNRRLMAAAVGACLFFGVPARGLKSDSGVLDQKSGISASSVLPNLSVQKKIFDKYSKDRKIYCRLDENGLHLDIQGKRLQIAQNLSRILGEPLELLCSDGAVSAIYSNGLAMYGAPGDILANLEQGQQRLIGTVVPFEGRVISAVFANEGKNALVAFERGVTEWIEINNNENYFIRFRTPLISLRRLRSATIIEQENIKTVFLPEISSYVLYSFLCEKGVVVRGFSLPEGTVFSCTEKGICTAEDRNGKKDELILPCSDK